MKLGTSLLAAVAIAFAAAVMLPAQVSVDGTYRYPELIVKDASSAPVGQVVGFDNFLPLALLEEGTNLVLVRASRTSLAGKHRVYYASNDCTGQAYLDTFDGSDGDDTFSEMQGVLYGIGKPFAGSVGVLYSTEGGSVVTPNTESEWISVNPLASRCFVTSRSGIDRVMATTVLDLDTVFTPPFDVE